MNRPIRIATRTSQLAMWQAKEVERLLQGLDANVTTELVPIMSDGDIAKTQGFDTFGYKGIFTKRIEAALLDGRADIAVHSMKDVHSELPDSLFIAATLKREDPRDAFISKRYASLSDMPAGTTIGTASVRRSAVITHLRPDLTIIPFRGNVPTRLEKLARGDVDATLLAAAGLKRLGLEKHMTAMMPPEQMLPAVAQGAIGIEARREDTQLQALLSRINHADTFDAIAAERAMLAEIDGDCHTPLCGFAYIDQDDTLSLEGRWLETDGRLLTQSAGGPRENALSIGRQVGLALKQQMKDTP